MAKKKLTQIDLVKEYFVKNPKKDIPHPKVVDWVVAEWKKRTGTVFRDPDRAIRSLYQRGFLIKIDKGVYRYEPSFAKKKKQEDFTAAQKKQILEKDGYKCVVCGRGEKDGVELHIDHIIPKDRGGKATVENGQVLCSQHNFLKKNLNQTETAKKMFINLYELTKIKGEKELNKFSADILKVFEKYGINGHIEWKK
ncbi:MAG TPA: HNH endonuclease signature motif containing protein [Salinivirgaceae bacterium]|nr:HNH endonuclease signature motif containing protein [Salinivirgaceae bacterium]HQA76139.1 HNH endonuclease signature motif containing protein [Salinivirgaceae bacterium]